jgi:hypothetical protein
LKEIQRNLFDAVLTKTKIFQCLANEILLKAQINLQLETITNLLGWNLPVETLEASDKVLKTQEKV